MEQHVRLGKPEHLLDDAQFRPNQSEALGYRIGGIDVGERNDNRMDNRMIRANRRLSSSSHGSLDLFLRPRVSPSDVSHDARE